MKAEQALVATRMANRARAEERRWLRGQLTQEKLIEILVYEPTTGIFRWREKQSNKAGNGSGLWRAGEIAGSKTKKGYIAIEIDGMQFFAHRLAWYYVHGVMPYRQVDHENLIKDDNRIANLRLATQSQNQHNTRAKRTSALGVKGVNLKKMYPSGNLKYCARITINRQRIQLGYFDTLEQAKQAYAAASQKFHGEFGRVE